MVLILIKKLLTDPIAGHMAEMTMNTWLKIKSLKLQTYLSFIWLGQNYWEALSQQTSACCWRKEDNVL